MKQVNLKIIIFITLFFCNNAIFVSCAQKQKREYKEYKLANLPNSLLDEWFANFKMADGSFSAKKFKPLWIEEANSNWYDIEPDTVCWLIFSPNSDFYLDLDFYSVIDYETIKTGIYMGGDIDTKVVLVDVRNKKAIDIIETNTHNGANDAFWVNDSVFVMLCQSFDMSKEEWSPYISVWNREKEIVRYIYEGKINNFRDDKYFPFYKRLQRLRIKLGY